MALCSVYWMLLDINGAQGFKTLATASVMQASSFIVALYAISMSYGNTLL